MINRIFASRLTGIAMILSAYIYLFFIPGLKVDIFLILSNLSIVVISIFFGFLCKEKPFSLLKMVLTFYTIFFGLAPLIEYKLGLRYWGGGDLYYNDYQVANMAILFSLISYLVTYYFFFRRSSSIPKIVKYAFSAPKVRLTFSLKVKFLFASMVTLVCVYYFYSFNLNGLLFRGGDFEIQYATNDKSIGLIIGNFFRPFIFNLFLVYLLFSQKIDKFKITLFVFALLGASPTALARFSTATLYLPLIYIYIWRNRLQGFYLNNIILFGFVFIFPTLDLFRAFRGFSEIGFNIGLDFFTAGHFDAYQQLVRIIKADSISFGYQLIGVILFFVPRSVWPEKPWGSGQVLADELGYVFSNVSMPFLGEGFINFGWFGIFLFVVLLGFISAKIDKLFWSNNTYNTVSLIPIAYMELIGLIFFIMRGDLMTSFAYTAGIMTSVLAVAFLMRSNRTKKKKRFA